ncbi:MAG: hypothetical protein U0575_15720 [Phycisphaerales bacterium]
MLNCSGFIAQPVRRAATVALAVLAARRSNPAVAFARPAILCMLCASAAHATGHGASDARRPQEPPPSSAREVDPVIASRGLVRAERIEAPTMRLPDDPAALRQIELPLTIGGARRAIRLERFAIRAAGCRLEIVGVDGARATEELPESTIWRGVVAGAADSSVVVSIRDNLMHGIVRVGDAIWSIEPIADGGSAHRHIVASIEDLAPASIRCAGTDEETAVAPPPATADRPLASDEPKVPGQPPAPSGAAAPGRRPPGSPPCQRELRLAVELDSAWIDRCDGRRDEAIARAELLLACVADEMARRVDVLLRETVVVVDERIGERTGDAPPTAGAIYADLWSRWSGRTDASGRNAIVLLSGRTFADRAFGLSWTGGIAGGPAQTCAVAGLGASQALMGRVAIVAHVLSHMVGAAHRRESPDDLLAAEWTRVPPPTIGAVAAAQIDSLVHDRGALRPPALASPADVLASDGTACGGVEVRWAEVPGAGLYRVLRSERDDVKSAVVVGEVAAPPFLDTKGMHAPGARYWVRAVDGCRESDPAGGDAGFLPAVVTAGPQASATDGVGCDEIVVTWPAVEGATSYQVLRSGVNNIGGAAPVGTSKEPRFVDAHPPPGAVLWYWVRGVDGCGGLGPIGRGDSGFTGGTPPGPTGVNATDGAACGSVIVTWNAVVGATSYAIWRAATTNLGDGSQIATVQSSPFEDASPPAGVDLYYWVRAVNPCGPGAFGGPDRGRAVTNVPRVAEIPDAVVSCGQPYQSPPPTLTNAECAVPVEWSIVSGPAGLVMAADGSVSWPAPTAGTHTLIIAARNARGVGQEQWMVQVTPHPLQFAAATLAPFAGRCGEEMVLAAPSPVDAACAGTIAWSLEGVPPGVTVGADGRGPLALALHRQALGNLVATNGAGVARLAWQATITDGTRLVEIKDLRTARRRRRMEGSDGSARERRVCRPP